MFGAICGDIIGSAYEFHNTKDYNFRLFTSESNFTDDSVMTAAVACWLIKDPLHTYEKLEEIMLEAASNCPCPMGGYGGAFYKWLFCPNMLQKGMTPYVSPTGRHPYGSWGNGSAMRVSAVGWFFDTLEETERVAEISAAITHNHPEGIKGAQATAAAIFLARTGRTKGEIKEYIRSRYGYDLSNTWEQLNRTYGWDSSCQGTVPPAIICFLESTGFEDAIRKAVSVGGDSDTLACITGGIAEAFYKEIPQEIEESVTAKLPNAFMSIITYMRMNTSYCAVATKAK